MCKLYKVDIWIAGGDEDHYAHASRASSVQSNTTDVPRASARIERFPSEEAKPPEVEEDKPPAYDDVCDDQSEQLVVYQVLQHFNKHLKE